jgi:hypothetical protein
MTYIYLIGTEVKQKIGFSKNIYKRIKQLQTGSPEKLVLHHYIEVPDEFVKKLEKIIHHELAHKRERGEWFNISKEFGKDFLTYMEIHYIN